HHILTAEALEKALFIEEHGFESGAVFDGNPPVLHAADNTGKVFNPDLADGITGSYNDMVFTYTGDGDRFPSDTGKTDSSTDSNHTVEKLHIDKVTETLFLAVMGQ